MRLTFAARARAGTCRGVAPSLRCSPHILAVGYRFKVGRVQAQWDVAKVVKGKSLRDWTYDPRVGQSMDASVADGEPQMWLVKDR